MGLWWRILVSFTGCSEMSEQSESSRKSIGYHWEDVIGDPWVMEAEERLMEDGKRGETVSPRRSQCKRSYR